MKHRTFCLFVWAASFFIATTAAGQTALHTWLWEPEAYRMLDDVGSFRDESLDFLERRGITTVYLYADQYHQNGADDYRPCDPGAGQCPSNRNIITDSPAKYQELIAEMHDRGMQVYALLGSAFTPTHAKEYHLPENQHLAEEMIQNVLNYNAATDDPKHRFDGVNTDLEPYTSPEFFQDRVQHSTWWLDTQAKMVQLRDQAITNGDPGSDIPIGPAIAFWTDGESYVPPDGVPPFEWRGETKPLSEHLQDLHDYITMQDFRDTANGRSGDRANEGPPHSTPVSGGDGLIQHARVEAEYAASIGQPFVLGVLTGPFGAPWQKTSFINEGAEWMQEQLALAEAYFTDPNNGTSTFSGIALQDFIDYQRLVQQHWNSSTDGNWDDADHWGIFEFNQDFEPRSSNVSGESPVRELDGILIHPDHGAVITGPGADTTIFWLSLGAEIDGVAELILQGNELTATNGMRIRDRGRLSGDGRVQADVTFEDGSQVHVLSGEAIAFDGDVTGMVDFTGTGAVSFLGQFSPGNSPAVIDFEGDVVFEDESTLLLEIEGIEIGLFDRLQIEGNLHLGGTLILALLDGFQPQPDDQFDLFDFATMTGTFDDIVLPNLGNGLRWDLSLLLESGQVQVIPEPGSFAILGGAVLTLMWTRGRAPMKTER